MAKGKKPGKPAGGSQEEPEDNPVDLGLGGFSIGSLLKGVGNVLDLVSELSDKAETLKREGKFKAGKDVTGVYGFSIRTMGGKPRVSTFGNIRETPQGPAVEEVREPMVDVFDEKDKLQILAEMPGVSEGEITLEIKGDILTIRAETGKRKYHKEVLLPCPVEDVPLDKKFNNGILEIHIGKKSG